MITLAERGWLPDTVIRMGIRGLLTRRLQQEYQRVENGASAQRLAELATAPITVHADAANSQHYEVAPSFFESVLGARLKYSCGYWEDGVTNLDESEAAMLQLTCERAAIRDGMQILELGCGWGSLTLWMAEHYPNSQILAVSNSAPQRKYIMQRAAVYGFSNVEVVTCDIADFSAARRFDRVVSVEMFEHVRNHARLLERIAEWLEDDGQLFVHIFCHKELTYLFQPEGRADWMARHFFTGGMMPAADWLTRLNRHLVVDEQWMVNGMHYAKTSEAWLRRLDQHANQLLGLFAQDMSRAAARRQLQRWRIFFMACAELFKFRGGLEWYVQHYRMQKAPLFQDGQRQLATQSIPTR